MTNQSNVFVKINDLKDKSYFDSLCSKCGIYPLSWQSLHFTDEVLIAYKPKKNGLYELLVRLNDSDYFTDVSSDKITHLIKDARIENVDTRYSTKASKRYEMKL